jgi:HD-like signal output (HDOD) protein
MTQPPAVCELPTPPRALLRISALLAEPGSSLDDICEVIESDMALAAALMRAVNSAYFALPETVHTVRHAATYLGLREVAAVTLQMGMQAAFPASPVLDTIWRRAALRGLFMGRLAHALNLDAWAAHSAGLFLECGKAVLFRHEPQAYGTLLSSAVDDTELLLSETEVFGFRHDSLGAALCETWGLGPDTVAAVRWGTIAWQTGELPPEDSLRPLCVLVALAQAALADPERLAEAVDVFAELMNWDVLRLRTATLRVHAQVAGLSTKLR